jgi:hypothetical protein
LSDVDGSGENLDEFARKQYFKRKPNANPFGDEENPATWDELDVFARVTVSSHIESNVRYVSYSICVPGNSTTQSVSANEQM